MPRAQFAGVAGDETFLASAPAIGNLFYDFNISQNLLDKSDKIVTIETWSGVILPMWPYLESIDRSLFFFFNWELQNSFFDWFMPFMTNLKNFTYPLMALGIWILWKQRRGGLVFLIFIGITLLITDQFSSHLLKNWVGRIRPCHVLSGIHMLTDCNTSYSFPSSHSVNSFAAAYFIAQAFPRISPIAFGIAAIAGYSRIYIGVHYPLDVIGGAGIGLLIAWPMHWLKERCLWLLERRLGARALGKPSASGDVEAQKTPKRLEE